ncbi:MAG: putative manganese-dependent inorganic diphosphatase [Candidatus Njordarchaeales archaeon]
MAILVIGHKNPDTDAIISAISFSHLLKNKGFDAKPFRLGDIWPETRIFLEKTNLQIPNLVNDVYPRAQDVMTKDVIFAYYWEPLKKAMDIIVSKGIRSLPIVDTNKIIVGLFSTESFARSFIGEIIKEEFVLRETPIKNFLEISNGKLLYGNPEGSLSGKIIVDWSLERIKKLEEKELTRVILVSMGDKRILREAIRHGIKYIIITGEINSFDDIAKEIKEKNATVILSPHDLYTTLRLLDLSQPVGRFSDKPVTVSEDALVKDIRNMMMQRGVRSIIVTDAVGRLRGIITRSDLVKDYRKKVALVDHNEFSQSVEGIEEAEIIAVVDHHRISGDVKTLNPIIFRIEPLGATNTIIWRLAKEEGIEIGINLAEAMLYAILSDTLLLKSPTTTIIDRQVVKEICDYVGLSLKEALEFVKIAMAANEPSDPKKIITMDLKIFSSKIGNFGIAQIMTTRPENYLGMLNSLKEVMMKEMRDRGLIFLVLMITDYIEERSFIIVVGNEEIVANALKVDLSEGYGVLPGVTSRKSQVLPMLLRYIETQ